jgi:hypothetical protein
VPMASRAVPVAPSLFQARAIGDARSQEGNLAPSSRRLRNVAGHTGGDCRGGLRARPPSVPSLSRAITIPVMAHTPKAPSPRDMVAGPFLLHADFGCDALLRRLLIIFDGPTLCGAVAALICLSVFFLTIKG